jgi:Hypothetical protein (DUF2513)
MADFLPKDAPDEGAKKLDILVTALPAHMYGKNWVDLNLTWQGHEFLETVRDPDVWERTKEGASR